MTKSKQIEEEGLRAILSHFGAKAMGGANSNLLLGF